MRFIVSPYRQPAPAGPYPVAVLVRDHWDDFHYKTMYQLSIYTREGASHLSNVKVVKREQGSGYTELPPAFSELPDEYCSLGQEFSYYEKLLSLGPSVYEPLLTGLKDAVFLPDVWNEFKNDDGFKTSLIRFDAARTALAVAPSLFGKVTGSASHTETEFEFEFPGVETRIGLSFASGAELPKRSAVVIGYNGSGKTRLLANLARVAAAGQQWASNDSFVAANGRYVGERPEFGAVIAISYSAFDNFTLPDDGHRSAEQSYTYCGLRVADEVADKVQTGEAASTRAWRLKTPGELAQEFHDARLQALEYRAAILVAACDALLAEPSFGTVVSIPSIDDDSGQWAAAFDGLSSGHKIALNIVVQLCAYLQPRSLVLVDEPELHLHPPLVAALLRAIGTALDRYSSFGVIATHSPVVLQEVPSSQVWVLRRTFEIVSVEKPEIETYAENVGTLTRQVFSLDSSRTDYQGILRELATTKSLPEIEALFPHGLSSQARSLVLSIQQRRATP